MSGSSMNVSGLGVNLLTGPVLIGADLRQDAQQALRQAGIGSAADGAPTVAITADLTDLPPTVTWIHSPNMGVEGLLRDLPPNVQLVTRTIGQVPERIATYVETMVQAERWALHTFFAQQAQSLWKRRSVPVMPVRDAAIVVGTGQVGSAVARRLRPFFTHIIGVSRSGTYREGFDAVVSAADAAAPVTGAVTPVISATASTVGATTGAATPTADAVPWREADCVVIALPSTRHTENAIGHAVLNQMSQCHLISVGRGLTLDLEALHPALASGAVRHATLDVHPVEPLPPTSWLWSHSNVTVTPHIAGLTAPTDILESFCAAHQALTAGSVPPEAVDFSRGY